MSFIHHSLKGGGTVDHSEEYHERFEETAVGVEGHFPFISGLNVYIIEAPVDIKFCEVFSSAELRDKFRDEGKRISVLDSHSIQCTIVLD